MRGRPIEKRNESKESELDDYVPGGRFNGTAVHLRRLRH
jgi:hypothetical protein